MDPASRKRVRKSTPRASRPNREPLRESPPRPTPRRKNTKKRGIQQEEAGEFWSLADPAILNEEQRSDGLYYLLNWADIDPRTGSRYPPDWQKAEYANEAAVRDWEQRKAGRAQVQSTQPSELSLPDSQESQESEPVRPAKRKRLGSPKKQSVLQGGSEATKHRGAGISETGRVQNASRQSADKVVQDTYEDENPSLHSTSGPGLLVEVAVPEGFDRTAYALAGSPQSSQQVSQSLTQSERALSQPYSVSQSTRSPYIWDEDIDNEIVVPDSEEQRGSSSYKPSDTVTSVRTRPVAATISSENLLSHIGLRVNRLSSDGPLSHTDLRRNTQSQSSQQSILDHLSAFSERLDTQTSTPHCRSGTVSDSIAEPQDSLSGASYRGTQVTSTQRESSVGSQSIPQSISPWKISSRNKSQSVPLPSRQIESALPHSSDRGNQYHSQAFANSQSGRSEHSEQFLTQVIPQSSPARESSGPPSLKRAQEGFQSSLPISKATHDKDSQQSATLAQESLPRQSATNLPLSSFEATWHAAKVISSVPVVSQDNLQLGSQERQSDTKSSEEYHSQSTHLPSPPVDEILPSIEQGTYVSSSAPAGQHTPSSSYAISSSPSRPRLSMEPGMSGGGGFDAKPKFDAKQHIKDGIAAKRAEIKARQEQRDRANNSSFSPSPVVTSPPPVQRTMELKASLLHVQMNGQETMPASSASHPSPPTLGAEHATTLDVAPPNREEFMVALPMVSYVRDIYHAVVLQHRSLTSLFVSRQVEVFDEDQVKAIDSMLDNLRGLCDHQEIYNDEFATQQSEPVSRHDQASFAEVCSTKVMFLATLLNRVHALDMHVVVVVRPGRMLEILESVFELHGLNYSTAGQQSQSGGSIDTSLRITLYPIGDQKFVIEPPSVVVAFDSTAEDSQFLEILRLNARRYPSGTAPILRLVVTHSIEHLELCINEDIDPIQKKIRLVRYLRQLGDCIGQLKGDYEDPTVAATAVAEYLEKGGSEGSWPLPSLPEIDEVDASSESPEMATNDEVSGGFENSSVFRDVPVHPGTKRVLADEDAMDIDSPKRQRFTPVPGEPAVDGEFSRVSDSLAPQSSPFPSRAISASSRSRAQGDDTDEVSSLLKKIKELEIQLSAKVTREKTLTRINRELEKTIADHRVSIENIQPKYQEALNDRGQFEYDMNLALEREKSTKKKLETRDAEIAKLKEKNADMLVQLSTAQFALSTSAVPEVSEMAKMKQEIAKLKVDNELLTKKLASSQNDIEYMRTNYQNSSSAAAEAASELREVQAANEQLQAKADTNRVKIHELQRDEDVANHLATIKRLRSENEDLRKECERQGDELERLKANRRNTRGASMPGSPRMGGGMSPRPAIGRSIAANIAGGSRSRGNSPAPGEMGGFGGILREDGTPSGRGGNGRWGNHLQQ